MSFLSLTSFIFCLCLLLSAFFSCAEAACTALNRSKLKGLIHRQSQFKPLIHLLSNPHRLLAGLFVGYHLFSAGAVVTAVFIAQAMLPELGEFSPVMIMISVTLVISLWMVVASDMIPRALAARYPEPLALLLSTPIRISLVLLTPFVIIFDVLVSYINKISGYSYLDSNQLITAEEIKNIISVGEKEGIIESVEKEMIHSIFEFSNTVIREIMTPRNDIVSIVQSASIQETIQLIKEHGHSRIPAYEGKTDNVTGIIFAKDLLEVSDKTQPISAFLREPMFVPETQNIVDLLHQMRKNKFHLAIVVDEYGGITGVVSMEDIIEEIIGEIQDEYDHEEENTCVEISPGVFSVDAGLNIEDVAEKLQVVFPKDEAFDTIGGFVLSLLEKFPHRGEVIIYKNIQFKVKEIHKHRILRVEIMIIEEDMETQKEPT